VRAQSCNFCKLKKKTFIIINFHLILPYTVLRFYCLELRWLIIPFLPIAGRDQIDDEFKYFQYKHDYDAQPESQHAADLRSERVQWKGFDVLLYSVFISVELNVQLEKAGLNQSLTC